MANYKNIKGFPIQYLDSDPPNPIEGQIWFNSTTQTLKGAEVGGVPSGTWASGGALNTGRTDQFGAGTQTSNLVTGGSAAPAASLINTELYDGSTWTEVNDLNQARQNGGSAGATNTAALIFGGYYPGPNTRYGNTESWNGTNWTEVNDLNTARNANMSCGTQTSALLFGGYYVPVGYVGYTESWNGTSWTELNDLNTARNTGGSFGYSNTAAVAVGGSPGTLTVVENWNGSSWTEIAELNTARTNSRGSGEATDGLVFGGYTTVNVANTELWNGTAWTELNDLSNARRTGSGSLGGTSSTALYAGGSESSPDYSTVTEEWTVAPISIKTFTTS